MLTIRKGCGFIIKVDFKTKNITGNKEKHFILIKRSIQEKM